MHVLNFNELAHAEGFCTVEYKPADNKGVY